MPAAIQPASVANPNVAPHGSVPIGDPPAATPEVTPAVVPEVVANPAAPADPAPADPTASTAPVVTMPDGTTIPLAEYKFKVGEEEMTPEAATEFITKAKTDYSNILTYRDNVNRWYQEEQAKLAANPATQPAAATTPAAGQAGLAPIDVSQHEFTENERAIALQNNQLIETIQAQSTQMSEITEYLKTNHEESSNRNLENDLRQASEKYGVTRDDLITESQKNGVHNLDIVGELLQRRAAETDTAKAAAAAATQAAAAAATNQVGTGAPAAPPAANLSNEPRRGLAEDAWKTKLGKAEIIAKYDILGRRSSA